MAEPTMNEYDQSTFTDSGTTDELASSATWEDGDIVIAFGGVSNNAAANHLGTPTVTGLSFAAVTTVNNDANNDDTQVFAWKSTASTNTAGQVASVTSNVEVGTRCGIVVYVFRGATGTGVPVTINGATSKTIPLTRVSTNSHVVTFMADWNQVGDVAVSSTPAGVVRLAVSTSGQADFFSCSFGDQGAAGGPVSYGITSHTGTVDMSGIAIEVFGTEGAPPELVRIFYPTQWFGMGVGGVQGGNRTN